MTDRPVLFKTDLVRKLPVKTQTRRLPSSQPPPGARNPQQQPDPLRWMWTLPGGGGWVSRQRFGLPGDRLWVRETWTVEDGQTVYRADANADNHTWRPAIHLPKMRARHWLIVRSVRPELLQDLTDADARAEGFANRQDFFAAWDWINGSGIGRISASAANPWVWVITFELQR